jgi:hypothetical protein
MTILHWPDYYYRTNKKSWWCLKSFCVKKKAVRPNNPSERAVWSNRKASMKIRPCVFLVVVSRSSWNFTKNSCQLVDSVLKIQYRHQRNVGRPKLESSRANARQHSTVVHTLPSLLILLHTLHTCTWQEYLFCLHILLLFNTEVNRICSELKVLSLPRGRYCHCPSKIIRSQPGSHLCWSVFFLSFWSYLRYWKYLRR